MISQVFAQIKNVGGLMMNTRLKNYKDILKNPEKINDKENKGYLYFYFYQMTEDFIDTPRRRRKIINVVLKIKNIDYGILILKGIHTHFGSKEFRKIFVRLFDDKPKNKKEPTTLRLLVDKYHKRLQELKEKEWYNG